MTGNLVLVIWRLPGLLGPGPDIDRRPTLRRPGGAAGSIAWLASLAVLALAVGDCEPSHAAEEENLQQVLATVDGVPVRRGDVRQELRSLLYDRRPDAADDPQVEREMLQQIVRRRLALAALVAEDRAASEEQMERVVADRRQQFEERGESLDAYLRENGISEESYRQRVRWELSWGAYQADLLTEENLRAFFDRHRRHFDGTQVRASHILLRPAEASQGEAPAAELERAREIRAVIESGSMTFAEAAAKHSDAPSRDRGGDIGYFPRRGVMHETFAAAAFRLSPGEISQPVVTPFGVHLIQLTDEKPGSRSFGEVRNEVYQAAEARLFDQLVAAGRERASIE